MKKIISLFIIALICLANPVTAVAETGYAFSQSKTVQDALLCVGNVRYVWGGGHQGTNEVVGINPIWRQFNKLYDRAPVNSGIGVDNYYCPLHPDGAQGDTCNFIGTYANNIKQLAQQRAIRFNISPELFNTKLSGIHIPEGGIATHRFDGLDCTGFCKWLVYQQAPVLAEEIGTTIAHTSFVSEVSSKYDLEPGDFISWREHIVMVIAKVDHGSYIHIESTPGVIRLGVSVTSYADSNGSVAQQLVKDYYSQYNMKIRDSLNVYDMTAIQNQLFTDKVTGELVDSGLKYVRLQNLNRDLAETSIYDILSLPSPK